MTQPVSKDKQATFHGDEYILEINDNFIKWGGSKTVAIPYNISQPELYELLSQINGVLFTGGGLNLSDPASGQLYYKTAKSIIEYSQLMKDVKNQVWPVLGICQGHEVISIFAAEDNTDVLDHIPYENVNRATHWAVHP